MERRPASRRQSCYEPHLSHATRCLRHKRTVRGSVHPQGRQYLPLLVHDGMVGYGFAWDDGAQHEEVFIDDHKELTVLTSKSKAVEDSLARYGLARIDGLDFISEHSHGHLNLEEPAGFVAIVRPGSSRR